MYVRETFWNVMYLVLNEIYFRGKLNPIEIIHISTDEDLEYDNDLLFMNIFTDLNICQMTGVLLSKMCLISVINNGDTEPYEQLEYELERCGFDCFGNETIIAKNRFYKSEIEYNKLFEVHQTICQYLEKTID